jgi:hypothetical protein
LIFGFGITLIDIGALDQAASELLDRLIGIGIGEHLPVIRVGQTRRLDCGRWWWLIEALAQTSFNPVVPRLN